MDMLRQLNRIGIFDNDFGRAYLTEKINFAFHNFQHVLQGNGRTLVEFVLMGPNGGVKMQTVWEAERLITVFVIGGG